MPSSAKVRGRESSGASELSRCSPSGRRDRASSPIRLVVLAPWGARLGGAEHRLLTILRNVDPSRIEPRVVFTDPGPFVAEMRDAGIPTALVPAGRLRDVRAFFRTIRRLRRLLRAWTPDVVFSWGAKPQLYGALATAGRRDVLNIWWQLEIPTKDWLYRTATALPA